MVSLFPMESMSDSLKDNHGMTFTTHLANLAIHATAHVMTHSTVQLLLLNWSKKFARAV